MRLLAVLPTRACTGRRFTFQRRLVTLWAWLMLLPNCGPLPQISQTLAMTAYSKWDQNLWGKALILPEFSRFRQTGRRYTRAHARVRGLSHSFSIRDNSLWPRADVRPFDRQRGAQLYLRR